MQSQLNNILSYPSYTEQNRFKDNFLQIQKEEKQQKQLKAQKKHLRMQAEQLIREQNKWTKMDNQFQNQFQKSTINNTSGLPYNFITLQYYQNEEGLKLKMKDDAKKVNQFMRKQNLDLHNTCGYDLINGKERQLVENEVPQDLKNMYQSQIDKVYKQFLY